MKTCISWKETKPTLIVLSIILTAFILFILSAIAGVSASDIHISEEDLFPRLGEQLDASQNSKDLFEIGNHWYDLGQYEEAIRYYDGVLAIIL